MGRPPTPEKDNVQLDGINENFRPLEAANRLASLIRGQ
jgi:hypothetical protein